MRIINNNNFVINVAYQGYSLFIVSPGNMHVVLEPACTLTTFGDASSVSVTCATPLVLIIVVYIYQIKKERLGGYLRKNTCWERKAPIARSIFKKYKNEHKRQ